MCHSKLLEALVQLANEARARREDEDPEASQDSSRDNGCDFVRLAAPGYQLH
jgi:hypothetical protein